MDTIVGTRLGAYLVEKRLGQGGMATVFIAVQSTTGRKVAIKTLPKSQLSDPKAVARFEREAKVLASLQHPHILPLIDYGEMGEYKFLVVPYLAHGDLEDRLQRVLGPLDLAESRRLLTQLAEALDHAHTQGVIHRDLKPGNVLLDGQGNAMLADFGIAYQAGSDRLTGVGFTVGTPEYMAPEQVNGNPEARSDLYALGVLAFRLLTGVLPFKGANATATLLLQRDSAAPDPHGVNPALSPQVCAFLSKALAKAVGERYQSGALFAQAVRAVLPENSPSTLDATQHVERPAVLLNLADTAFLTGEQPSHLTAPALDLSELARAQSSAERDRPALVGPGAPAAENLVALASAALSRNAQVTSQRPVVTGPAPPRVSGAAGSVPSQPVTAGTTTGRTTWLIVVIVLLLVAAAIWFWLGKSEQSNPPQIRVPSEANTDSGNVLAAGPAAVVSAAPADGAEAPDRKADFQMYEGFDAPLDPSRWQAVGGLTAKVQRGRLQLSADRPQQWLRARGLPPFDAASVKVQLMASAGAATEAAAGLTLSRGDWWLSCHLHRYAGSGQLESRCLENDQLVYQGGPVADEPQQLALVLAADGRYQFQLNGRTQARIKPRRSAAEPLMLVLSLWTPQAGAKVTAVFDEVQLARVP